MRTDVLIIGGGIAGLTCGVGLAGSGLHVTLVEQQALLGGRARSWVDEHTGDVVDIGPHVVLSEYPNMLRLLSLLGTEDRITWNSSNLLTLVDGEQVAVLRSSRLPAPLHLLPSLMRVQTISTRDLISNHQASWFAMRANEEDLLRLDGLDALTFLRRMKATERFIDWFWASVCMAIMNVPLEQCSAGALLRFYRIVLAHPDLRLGFADAGLSELFAAQAVNMIDAEGGRVITGAVATALSVNQGVVDGALLADGRCIKARFCVSAIEPKSLQRLAPTELAGLEPFAHLGKFEPSPYISSYLWFDRKLGAETNWARTWSPEKLNYDFYDLANIRRGWQDRCSVIASNIIYSHRAEHLSDAEIIEATRREIAEFAPEAARAEVRHARVHRIPMAISCPHPGIEALRPHTRTAVPGLLLAGDWVATGLPASMESAARSGWLAAEQVLQQVGRGRPLAQDIKQARGLMALTSRFAPPPIRTPAARAGVGISMITSLVPAHDGG